MGADCSRNRATYAAQTEMLKSRCRELKKENRRMQDQYGQILSINQDLSKLASELVRDHVKSSPEIRAVLRTRSRTLSARGSSSSGPHGRGPGPDGPGGSHGGLSSAHARVCVSDQTVSEIFQRLSETLDHASRTRTLPETSGSASRTGISTGQANHAPTAGPPLPEENTPVPEMPSEAGSAQETPDLNSESISIVIERPRSTQPTDAEPEQRLVPTSQYAQQESSVGASSRYQSDTNLEEQTIIVDDGRGLREEFRRPRVRRQHSRRRGPRPRAD